jgi:PLP dependent protein
MTLASSYARLKAEIANRATLIAVSKTVDSARIEEVITLGHTHFGENYVQETLAKWEALKEAHSVTLHMIGPLQSNKAREAVKIYDIIQTLDRSSLATAIAREIDKQGKTPKLFIQVNIGEEPQKGGVLPQDTDAFIKTCQKNYGLKIEGLMCIPPADSPPKPYFQSLKTIAERNGLKELSMGMSSDYIEAINEGATYVRVGSALFGARG